MRTIFDLDILLLLYVIGASEGVEKLKEMQDAIAFTSIEDVFSPNSIDTVADFKQQLQTLITNAKIFGVGLETIEKILITEANQLMSTTNKNTVEEEIETVIDSSSTDEPTKQMSIFDARIQRISLNLWIQVLVSL